VNEQRHNYFWKLAGPCSGLLAAALAVAQQPSWQRVVSEGAPEALLTRQQIDQIMDEAAETQQTLRQVCGAFHVRYELDLEQLPATVPELHVQRDRIYEYTEGVASGVMSWWRDGVAERVEIVFDLPEELKRFEYEDAIVVDDGQFQVHQVTRTGQIAILHSGPISCPTPADWLLPAFRRTFAELAADESWGLAAWRRDDGCIGVRIELAEGGDQTTTVGCVLDPDSDYAVVAWACPQWGTLTNIEYERATDGRVVPTYALQTVTTPGSARPVRRAELWVESIRVGPVEPEALRFHFKPGMVVADNRPEVDGKRTVKAYRVNARGDFEEVPINSFTLEEISGPTIALGATGVLAVLAVLALRARAALAPAREP